MQVARATLASDVAARLSKPGQFFAPLSLPWGAVSPSAQLYSASMLMLVICYAHMYGGAELGKRAVTPATRSYSLLLPSQLCLHQRAL